MSLSRWMRDYLYIPLGGSRVKTKARLYFNLWLVFIISGFWHGASWNFIVWGGFHGFFLICDRLFFVRFTEKIGKIPSVIITYIIVLVGWVFFRAETLPAALAFIKAMFSFHFSSLPLYINDKVWFFLLFALVASWAAIVKPIENFQNAVYSGETGIRVTISTAIICIFLLILCAGGITSSGFNPFIYFRF